MCFEPLTATQVGGAFHLPFRVSTRRPGERGPCIYSHRLPPCLARAACSGDEQVEGHEESSEQPPEEVPLEGLTRRAQVMFSGKTGAVVASGGIAAPTAPTFCAVSYAPGP